MDMRGIVVARPTDTGPADSTKLPAIPIRVSGRFNDSTTQSIIQAPISFTSGTAQ